MLIRTVWNDDIKVIPAGAIEQFYSSWETGTGTTATVVRDNGAFNSADDFFPGSGGILDVVAGSGLAYPGPGTNLLRIEIDGENAANIETFNEVARGESMFVRFLIRFDGGTDANLGSHFFVNDIFSYRGGYISPVSSGYTSGFWGLKFQCDAAQPGAISPPNAYPFYGWYMVDGLLATGTWYEVVYEMRHIANENDDPAPTGTGQPGTWPRTNGVEYQPFISVYDMTGTLVADQNDMRCVDYGGNGANLAPHGDSWDLGQWIAAGRTFVTPDALGSGDTGGSPAYDDQLDIFRRFSLGNNGQAGQTAGSGSDYVYIGDFGIYTQQAPDLISSTLQTWALDSNLPGGMTLRTYNDHSTSWGTGWSYAERDGSQTNVTRITDATAPSPITLTGQADDTNTGSSVINQNWAGVADGQSPDFLYWTPSAGRNHIFVSTVMYVSSEMIPANEVKVLEWQLDGGWIWLGIYPAGNGKNPGGLDQWVGVSRHSGDTITDPVGGGMAIPLDQWCKVQYEVQISPVRFRVWVNDTLVQQESGTLTFDSSTQFSEFQQGAVWGGGNAVAAPSGALIKYAATAIWTN